MNRETFRRGINLFNLADFFDAHEVWEDVWRAAPDGEKKFLQGLIQIAVGLHHYSTGNHLGAQSLLARACRNLAPYPQDFGGIDLSALRRAVEDFRQTLPDGPQVRPLPRIKTLEC